MAVGSSLGNMTRFFLETGGSATTLTPRDVSNLGRVDFEVRTLGGSVVFNAPVYSAHPNCLVTGNGVVTNDKNSISKSIATRNGSNGIAQKHSTHAYAYTAVAGTFYLKTDDWNNSLDYTAQSPSLTIPVSSSVAGRIDVIAKVVGVGGLYSIVGLNFSASNVGGVITLQCGMAEGFYSDSAIALDVVTVAGGVAVKVTVASNVTVQTIAEISYLQLKD